jgi:hypothetical protein
MAKKQTAALRRTAGGRPLRARLVSMGVKVATGGLICGLVMCLPVGAAQAVNGHHAHPVTVVK